jgi:predicted amidohydrolase YtcJ
VIRNANIITMDPANPYAEWVALSDGIIQAVGTGRDYERFASGSSTLIDCRGGTVLPGFIDAHLHLHAFAESCVSLNLTHSLGFKSINDIKEAIRNQCQEKQTGTWIRGRLQQILFGLETAPRWDLDESADITRQAAPPVRAYTFVKQLAQPHGISLNTEDL